MVAYFSNGEVLYFLIWCGDISLGMAARVFYDRAVAYTLGRMVVYFSDRGCCMYFFLIKWQHIS